MLIDIHSHLLTFDSNQKRILNWNESLLGEVAGDFSTIDSPFLSLGVHPWESMGWNVGMLESRRTDFMHPKILIIGEIGMDKTCLIPLEQQLLVFCAQLKIADEIKKPVLLHVVKTMSDVLRLKKMFPHIPAWIIHGFRGGKMEAEDYIRKGFYLSFGYYFKPEGLLACPAERLFIETDNREDSLSLIYERIAKARQSTVEKLEVQIERNFLTVFGK